MPNPFDHPRGVNIRGPYDTDIGPLSPHHTLGPTGVQAAPGNHNHDTVYPTLKAVKNVFTGKAEYNGGAFVNGYDTVLWIAGAVRSNPVINSQGLYIQHRVSNNLGGYVHDAGASELRLANATNTGVGQNAFEGSIVITSGANAIGNTNVFTSNFHSENAPTGTVGSVALYRSQTIPALTGTLTIDKVYGIYVEPQTVGVTENWSVYAPNGTSLFQTLRLESTAPSTARSIQFTTNNVLRWILRTTSTAETGAGVGSDLELSARTDTGAAALTPLSITRSSGLISINNGLKVTGNIGFYGTAPIAKQTLAANATDPATTQTLVNDIKTKLVALGLVA